MKNSNNSITEKPNSQLIIAYIENNNLTKKEFCQQCKISISTFYKIINGKNINLISLFKIAKIMNVPVHMFFK
ncbi:MAG: helix-turn-helix transcriptional regulator [Clostridiales bacterium]|nr:helix-turn-helix transcriptional regulator [Clostridiales bacterium]